MTKGLPLIEPNGNVIFGFTKICFEKRIELHRSMYLPNRMFSAGELRALIFADELLVKAKTIQLATGA